MDVERLLRTLAECGALWHWRSMRAKKSDDAIGVMAWLSRRRWGMTALRENARLLLERLEYVGCGADAAARRRLGAAADVRARVRRSAMAARGPRRCCPFRGWDW